ncbi:MAG: lysine-2,3-aminomutase-like protein [Alphaproteobacteria bacterium]
MRKNSRHCEEPRATKQSTFKKTGLLRYARNDEEHIIIERVSKKYAVSITPHVMSTMKGPASTDPVAKQYVPQMKELVIAPEESLDPIGDDAHTPVKGLVHRYTDRVLFKIVNVCAVYCRYCFRREMVGPGAGVLTPAEQNAALDYIRADRNIWEVILSGGDPLVMAPPKLKKLMDEIAAIEHVQVIRIHTRIPAADPARVTHEMAAAFKQDKAVYVAVHINHAQEITPEVERAFKTLRSADCVLLSQSVLLKGVNDDAGTLEELFRSLTALRVKPYYLHHADRAPGTSHFRTTIQNGQSLMKQLRARLSGIARPAYMLDIPGGHGKISIDPTSLTTFDDEHYLLEDPQGNTHTYTS